MIVKVVKMVYISPKLHVLSIVQMDNGKMGKPKNAKNVMEIVKLVKDLLLAVPLVIKEDSSAPLNIWMETNVQKLAQATLILMKKSESAKIVKPLVELVLEAQPQTVNHAKNQDGY